MRHNKCDIRNASYDILDNIWNNVEINILTNVNKIK